MDTRYMIVGVNIWTTLATIYHSFYLQIKISSPLYPTSPRFYYHLSPHVILNITYHDL